ncbi:hypothetical protein CLV94_2075 [Flavobacterium endophyticum]|uniref:Uncharacterized protein n=1 Tax=Flavobacterium endophyticum TaxID=1540163 RepID=A0A495MCT4_9FLAO|nr:hypothetical protein CLV94_2075 [Flavobacterium endophyticum]
MIVLIKGHGRSCRVFYALFFLFFRFGFFFCFCSQTPQVPPSLAQCLHPLQFLQALQYSAPLHPLLSQEANNTLGFVCAIKDVEERYKTRPKIIVFKRCFGFSDIVIVLIIVVFLARQKTGYIRCF